MLLRYWHFSAPKAHLTFQFWKMFFFSENKSCTKVILLLANKSICICVETCSWALASFVKFGHTFTNGFLRWSLQAILARDKIVPISVWFLYAASIKVWIWVLRWRSTPNSNMKKDCLYFSVSVKLPPINVPLEFGF